MRYLLFLMAIVSFWGCVPYADTPLTDPGVQPIDAQILGTWYWKDNADAGFLHIGLDEAAKTIKLILIEYNKNNEVVASEFRGHTSNIKGRLYLNLKPVKPGNTASGFILVRYVMDKDALGISLMNAQVVTKDIESGALAGQVTREEWTSSIHISASQEQLRQYILAHDASLYPDTKFLSRLNLPPGRVSP